MSPSKKPEPRAPSNLKPNPQQESALDSKPASMAETSSIGWRSLLLRIVAVAAVIVITVLVYEIRDRVEQFAALGYPGVFLIALLANATVLLPAPGTAVVFALGSILNPVWVALAAATGGAIGELTGYLAGVSGHVVLERAASYHRVLPWVQRYGGWAVLGLAALPNPVFDLAGIAAGVVGMPFRRFLLFCWLGQLVKMTSFAFAGRYSVPWLAAYMQ